MADPCSHAVSIWMSRSVTVDGAMRDPDQFDLFYKDVRARLLLLTYCLTGDLSSSRAAVRDAFVAAWHQWRKVSQLEDPEAWVRAHASSRAQRRRNAKLWHREKGLDPEVQATLDALAKLPLTRRKVLLLTELTTVSLDEMAREVGLPRAEAERELQAATSQFAVQRQVATTSVRAQFEPVRAHVEDTRWPRATIVRRAGAARRRTHTLVGVVGTVAALVVTGTLVTDAEGVRPTLSGARVNAAGTDESAGSRPAPEPVDLPEESMLTAEEVGRFVPGRWTETRTDDNTAGSGQVMPCQDSRYANPRSSAALVRTFEAHPQRKSPPATAVQTTEVAARPEAAARGYRTAVDWFAACTDDRAQLLSTLEVDGVGDEATVLVLRTWKQPASYVVAGVSRTGQITTTTLTRSAGAAPKPKEVAGLLGEAVSDLCSLDAAGTCSTRPRLSPTAPVPVGSTPGMLAEVDLPPVAGIRRAWVGTEPRQARDNDAATGCDQANFGRRPVSNGITRTFLIPGAGLPAQFGLTETVGSIPETRAAAFVDDVRAKLARCSDKQMGTQVAKVAHVDRKRQDLTVWRVTTEISDDESVSYFMGIVRDGTSVAQVGFMPAGRRAMSQEDFVALMDRALDRLPALPPPRGR